MMTKKYFVWEDRDCNGIGVKWIKMSGKEFYAFIKGPCNSGRHFIDFGDYILEATAEKYYSWKKGKAHEDYIKKYNSRNPTVSIYEDAEDGLNKEEILADDSVDVENAAINSVIAEQIMSALGLLSEEDRRLIKAVFFSKENRTEVDIAADFNLSQSGFSKRKKAILKKLKILSHN